MLSKMFRKRGDEEGEREESNSLSTSMLYVLEMNILSGKLGQSHSNDPIHHALPLHQLKRPLAKWWIGAPGLSECLHN